MILGFTGTERGMTLGQRYTVATLLRDGVVELHLGDCIGADEETYEIAVALDIVTIGHPPSNGYKRAHRDYDEERSTKPYLDRNTDIAREGLDGLIAAPGEDIEVLRSGTWATVRRARKLGRRIWIVRSDGTIIKENH